MVKYWASNLLGFFSGLKPAEMLQPAVTRKIKPLTDKLDSMMSSYSIDGFLGTYYKNHEDPLLRGDRLTWALQAWPREKFPLLYRQIPNDIRRPLISDGRLPNGDLPIRVLPPSHIDQVLIDQARAESIKSGAFWFITALGITTLAALAAASGAANVSHGEYAIINDATTNFWSQSQLTSKAGSWWRPELFADYGVIAATGSAFMGLAISFGAAFSAALGATVFWGNWRKLIVEAADRHAAPYRPLMKESIVRWKSRFGQRRMEYDAYLAQIDEASKDNSRFISWGFAEGETRLRGMLSAPIRGQVMGSSIHEMFRNTIIFGKTGSGKSWAVLEPAIAQLIDAMDHQDMSLYITDAKGVLWQRIKKLAKRFGREMQVIGVGEDEIGVDLINGLDPALVADTLQSVSQTQGSGETSFWGESQSEITRNVAVIVRAWERTPGGRQYAIDTGERPYSLITIYNMIVSACNVEGMAKDMVKDVLEVVMNDPGAIKDLAGADLFAAIEYIRGDQWLHMAKDTRDGVLAHVSAVMKGFVSSNDLRRRFASGAEGNFTIQDAWGYKITGVNLPDTKGFAYKVVNVFLKTLLFAEAKNRENEDPDIAQKQQLAYVVDEGHGLVTVGKGGVGLSDDTWPAMCRSSGMFYLFATQSISGLEQRMGDDATESFVENFSNILCTQTTEKKTQDYLIRLGGRSVRFSCQREEDFESIEALQAEKDIDVMNLGPARLSAGAGGRTGLFSALSGLKWLNFSGAEARYSADTRFLLGGNIFATDSSSFNSAITSQQQAEWRSEDKNESWMREGNTKEDILSVEDFTVMGRRKAVALLFRGGHMRMDIIRTRGVEDVMKELGRA